MIDTIKRHNAFLRQTIFLAILIASGVAMLLRLEFFIGSFLGAVAFYIVFRRPVLGLVERRRWPAWVASLAVVSAICVALLGLGYLMFNVVAGEIADADMSQLPDMAREMMALVNRTVGYNLLTDEMVLSSTNVAMKVVNSIVSTTYSFVANIMMMMMVLYFMLAHVRRLEENASRYMPFSGESRRLLLDEMRSLIYSNAVGIPFLMLIQGVVAALVYWLFGMSNVIFWAFLTAICGLVPMVGTIIVSVPLGVWFISQGMVPRGIALMLCGLLIIANVDNLARILLNRSMTHTHPLVVIFGVILGIPLLGFWGIIFGPLLISTFLLLVRIYYKEYRLLAPEDGGTSSDTDATTQNTGPTEDTAAP